MAPPLRANRQGQELDTGAKWLIVGAIGTLVAFGAIIAAGAGDNTSSSETFGSAGRSSTAMRALTSNPDTLTSAALVALELELHGDGVSLEHDAAHARFVEVALDSAEALLRKPARNAMQARVLLGALGDATEAQRDRRDEMLGAIEAAEAAQRAVVEREKQRALAALTREVDEFNGITWYKDPSHPRYANNRAFRIYIGEKDGDRWLRMLIRYAGDNWLFVERFVFLVDGVTYTVDPGGHFEVERDNSYGGVWEWYDTKPSDSEMELIRAVANSTSARLRFEGRYRSDWTIPASQRAAIKRVLAAYDALQN